MQYPCTLLSLQYSQIPVAPFIVVVTLYTQLAQLYNKKPLEKAIPQLHVAKEFSGPFKPSYVNG